jgi:hypothetical protein
MSQQSRVNMPLMINPGNSNTQNLAMKKFHVYMMMTRMEMVIAWIIRHVPVGVYIAADS